MTRLAVEVGSRRREALVSLPEPLPSGAPVLVVVHGAGATAEMARGHNRWAAFVQRRGVVAVFPEGTRADPAAPPAFRQNPQTWNDGSGRGHVARDGVDDVAFVSALLDAVEARWPVDRNRVYATGFSNGGSLVFRLAAEMSERLAAAVPVAGHLWIADPRPARPVPLLLISGAADPLNPVDGGTVRTPWGHDEYHPPIAESARRWAAAIGCDPEPRELPERPGLRTLRWAGAAGGAEVRFTLVEGLGHAWPGGRRVLPEWIGGPSSDLLDGTEAAWRFLSSHHL